jgi:hypothetical protein
MSFAGKWVELVIILLSTISQSHKDKYCMFSIVPGPIFLLASVAFKVSALVTL